ncbi:C40 family peptidase [Hydromonas duriensis]|uniref:Cell wall-associated NlpC family hydrolase n=1 Tax=Hydromonas duriensis TaxID=1527608 RepID=A0A4R6Y6U9_9BURK|nr:C40 family peptidase [Hydromonas duriensis]TDR31132.1 cell wall-associated NlpC family hydrolase [Hydromonas duriensis]
MFFKLNLQHTVRAVVGLVITASLALSSTSALADDSFSQKLLSRAMDLVGVKYRFGGTSPTTGLDCSGYVQYVFKNAVGVSLPRVASAQSQVGEKITDVADMRPGDMVFFNTRGFAYSHVGIYVGNGTFLHSPRTGSSVRFDRVDSPYWKSRFNGARRVSASGSQSNDFKSNAPLGM